MTTITTTAIAQALSFSFDNVTTVTPLDAKIVDEAPDQRVSSILKIDGAPALVGVISNDGKAFTRIVKVANQYFKF